MIRIELPIVRQGGGFDIIKNKYELGLFYLNGWEEKMLEHESCQKSWENLIE